MVTWITPSSFLGRGSSRFGKTVDVTKKARKGAVLLSILFRLLGVIAVFIMIVLLIGTLIPRDYDAATHVVIKAPPEVIFPELNTIKRWSNWSMWSEHEIEGLTVTYSGPASGVGAIQEWTEPRGAGVLEITESIPNQKIGFVSEFSNFPEMDSTIRLDPQAEGTKVTWQSIGSLPSGPFYGWFGMTINDSLEMEFRKALNKLKVQSESKMEPAEAVAETVEVLEEIEVKEGGDPEGSEAKKEAPQ